MPRKKIEQPDFSDIIKNLVANPEFIAILSNLVRTVQPTSKVTSKKSSRIVSAPKKSVSKPKKSTPTLDKYEKYVSSIDREETETKRRCKWVPINTKNRKMKVVDDPKVDIKSKKERLVLDPDSKDRKPTKQSVRLVKETCDDCHQTFTVSPLLGRHYVEGEPSAWRCDNCIKNKKR